MQVSLRVARHGWETGESNGYQGIGKIRIFYNFPLLQLFAPIGSLRAPEPSVTFLLEGSVYYHAPGKWGIQRKEGGPGHFHYLKTYILTSLLHAAMYPAKVNQICPLYVKNVKKRRAGEIQDR